MSLVFTVGCFDILHPGHIDYLQKASMYGQLVVGITSDKTMRKLKREPIFSELERADMVFSIKGVSDVYIVDKAADLIKTMRPEIYIKGGDYNLGTMNQEERQILESYGAIIKFIPIVYDHSSSKIMEAMKREESR